MASIQDTSSDAAKPRDRDEPASATDDLVYECYCGLGPACPIFMLMTAEQRTACTRDKRRMAQSYYRNGVDW